MELLRNRMFGNNLLPLIPFIAPSTFYPSVQTVNIHKIYSDYSNSDKAFGYSFADTVNTLTLSAGTGISYRVGYTRSGIDTVVDGANFTNPFITGDTKRYVIVNNSATTISAVAPIGAKWVYYGKKCTTIAASYPSTHLNYVHIELTNQFTTIANNAFRECIQLSGKLTIPQGVTSIGSYCIYAATGITEPLIIPNSVITIGQAAFYRSGVSGSISITSSVTTIGSYVLADCNLLNGSLSIGNGIANNGIGEFFIANTYFATIDDFVGTNFEILNKILYLKTGGVKTKLVGTSRPTAIANLSILSTITVIYGGAFSGCTNLTGSLTVNSGCLTIGQNSFAGCTGLTTSLNLPSSITTILGGGFLNCTNLTELNLASGYNPVQGNDNWKFNFSNNFTAASLNQSILNIAGGGNTTRTITIGATNKARLLAAYPSAETNANARGITIV